MLAGGPPLVCAGRAPAPAVAAGFPAGVRHAAVAPGLSSTATCSCVCDSTEAKTTFESWRRGPVAKGSRRCGAPSTSAPYLWKGQPYAPPGRRPTNNVLRHQSPAALGLSSGGADSGNSNGDGGDGHGSSSRAAAGDRPLPVIDPVVLDEHGMPLPEASSSSSGIGSSSTTDGTGTRGGSHGAAASREAGIRAAVPAPDSPPARWTALLQLPPAVWGVTWLLTAGPVSVAYTCLAAASAIAATAFSGLVPGPTAAVAAAAAATGTAGVTAAAPAGATAAAAAAAVAAVDWLDVAMRTANGLAAGGAARAQVLQTLQEAGAGALDSWAVQALLPALCGAASGARGLAVALQPVDPVLGALSQLASVAAGLGLLLVMGLPLRPYLAPLLPLLPRGRPSPATMAALRAGGVACMVAVLTGLQAVEVTAPELGRSVRSAAAAAAAGVPLLAQVQACLYGAFAVAADVVVPAATAVVAARAAAALRRGGAAVSGGGGNSSSSGVAQGVRQAGQVSKAGEAKAEAEADERLPRELTGARWLGAGRLALDVLLLAAVGCGGLSAHLSAVRLLGMLWLFQTARQVAL